jgi:hypothetical protein
VGSSSRRRCYNLVPDGIALFLLSYVPSSLLFFCCTFILFSEYLSPSRWRPKHRYP